MARDDHQPSAHRMFRKDMGAIDGKRGHMALGDADRAVLRAHADQIDEVFDRSIGSADRVAVLQYPYDGNVGNHMMWLALAEYLRSRSIPIAYAAYWKSFRVDDLRRAIGTDPILFCGGVTLSQLWPGHPEVKRQVAAAFPENRLVSLTSTMIFVDRDDELQAGTIFGDHPSVTVMARDPLSAESARRVLGPNVRVTTAHDSALRLEPTAPANAPSSPIIWLERDDHESKLADVPDDVTTFDWSNYLRRTNLQAYVILRTTGVLSRLRSMRIGRVLDRLINPLIVRGYERASRLIVRNGHRTLDTGQVLVTDRMHPHVLAALRGQHVVLLPDRYGKNRAVYEYSTAALSCVHWADDPDQALALARHLCAGSSDQFDS